ncbi:hypothetical protein [Sulfuriroseicoccus oceanibius]|uniref:Uncharacterized protein n=1 Tax=Sulfuriroseicoccus oceanibius TaxID=2707525 RepID=A0A6B3LGF1_9BACT|nr:hypothetical protein [Sulfuriroseicoccus oceanibius]QQL44587.1 hypothetical protein G3M56_011950 [Sulfuriroseicoccus oceanibius]
MKRLPRHLSIALVAAIVGFIAAPRILGVSAESVLRGIEWHAAIVSAGLWFTFSLLLRKPKIQQWLIIGFVSPFIGVPLFYQMAAWKSGYGSQLPELGSALYVGLIAATLLSWLLIPVGLLTGGLAAIVSRPFAKIEAQQVGAQNP